MHLVPEAVGHGDHALGDLGGAGLRALVLGVAVEQLAQERQAGAPHDLRQVDVQEVLVLVQEAGGGVHHVPREVLHSELERVQLPLDVVRLVCGRANQNESKRIKTNSQSRNAPSGSASARRVRFLTVFVQEGLTAEALVELGDEGGVGTVAEAALLVQQAEYSQWAALREAEAGGVVLEVDEANVHALRRVVPKLHLEPQHITQSIKITIVITIYHNHNHNYNQSQSQSQLQSITITITIDHNHSHNYNHNRSQSQSQLQSITITIAIDHNHNRVDPVNAESSNFVSSRAKGGSLERLYSVTLRERGEVSWRARLEVVVDKLLVQLLVRVVDAELQQNPTASP
eukprot:1196063-Prorocentrum_minimum.AAC.5